MIYGYIRVSTDKQDCANQKLGIESKAKQLNLSLDKYIEDAGISGTCAPEKRALGGILKKLKPGDIIICSELSRLGRQNAIHRGPGHVLLSARSTLQSCCPRYHSCNK